MKNVLVIFGSMTPEHDLSCKSAGYILENIDRTKYSTTVVGITAEGKWLYTEATPDEIRDAKAWESSPTNKSALLNVDYGSHELLVLDGDAISARIPIDCVFARIAGNTGEDGKLQGLFELAGIPYVGCDVASSAIGMDKDISYYFADIAGIRRPATQTLAKAAFESDKEAAVESIKNGIVEKVGYPIFAKPASAGSSIGISKVHCEEELLPALEAVFAIDSKAVFEENIVGTEIKVGVLGNDTIEFGAICKLDSNGDFNDFDTKYISHRSNKEIPAILPAEVEERIKKNALDIWQLMGCSGFSRIDFFLTPDNEVVFNEINTMPGFKPESVYPELFASAGVAYPELISRLLDLAFEKHS